MPRIVLAPALARWLTAAPGANVREVSLEVEPGTVREVLEQVFAIHPSIRGYIVDELGALRQHVMAFLDGEPVRDKRSLADPVTAGSELYIFQALSGG